MNKNDSNQTTRTITLRFADDTSIDLLFELEDEPRNIWVLRVTGECIDDTLHVLATKSLLRDAKD